MSSETVVTSIPEQIMPIARLLPFTSDCPDTSIVALDCRLLYQNVQYRLEDDMVIIDYTDRDSEHVPLSFFQRLTATRYGEYILFSISSNDDTKFGTPDSLCIASATFSPHDKSILINHHTNRTEAQSDPSSAMWRFTCGPRHIFPESIVPFSGRFHSVIGRLYEYFSTVERDDLDYKNQLRVKVGVILSYFYGISTRGAYIPTNPALLMTGTYVNERTVNYGVIISQHSGQIEIVLNQQVIKLPADTEIRQILIDQDKALAVRYQGMDFAVVRKGAEIFVYVYQSGKYCYKGKVNGRVVFPSKKGSEPYSDRRFVFDQAVGLICH